MTYKMAAQPPLPKKGIFKCKHHSRKKLWAASRVSALPFNIPDAAAVWLNAVLHVLYCVTEHLFILKYVLGFIEKF